MNKIEFNHLLANATLFNYDSSDKFLRFEILILKNINLYSIVFTLVSKKYMMRNKTILLDYYRIKHSMNQSKYHKGFIFCIVKGSVFEVREQILTPA